MTEIRSDVSLQHIQYLYDEVSQLVLDYQSEIYVLQAQMETVNLRHREKLQSVLFKLKRLSATKST